MRTLYLTTMIFCHILLSSFILYSTLTSALPVVVEQQQLKPISAVEPPKHVDAVAKPQEVHQTVQYVAAAPKPVEQPQPVATQHHPEHSDKIQSGIAQEKDSAVAQKSSAAKQHDEEAPKYFAEAEPNKETAQSAVPQAQQQKTSVVVDEPVAAPLVAGEIQPDTKQQQQQQQTSPVSSLEQDPKQLKLVPDEKSVIVEPAQPKIHESAPKSVEAPSVGDSLKEKLVNIPAQHQPEPIVVSKQQQQAVPSAIEISKESRKIVIPEPAVAPEVPKQVAAAALPEQASNKPASHPPAVKGGLGPLHLLAATLCSYQPHKPVSDETLTYLYNQRAAQRRNLFQFMSLKFTNLDKLTSHLNAGGLEVVKTVDSSESSLVRSHGWPVVGNCTAHYLKLMAEAAWCDCVEEQHCQQQQQQQPRLARRSVADEQPATASVISKLMYVGDVKEAPVVESSQKQAVAQPATVASTRQCRRNALRLAKALFNHLAENQTEISESWPKLYSELAQDECARKRMIDIVSALSTFRSESTQVHRDNIEFAFAMDDLRGKVLENEVNTPLTFDKQVIEVEQFLQQSVRLMLANIDPKRAKLTSMRYRSLHAPVSADDQCIELHQRLLAKNYPDECNPNQYGPLPDVLRMAALSLDLWSIEQDLSKYSTPSLAAPKQQEINECIANLVAN